MGLAHTCVWQAAQDRGYEEASAYFVPQNEQNVSLTFMQQVYHG